MKKEFSTLIQFIIIAGLVVVFFRLALPIQYPEISIEAMEEELSYLKYWIYSFIGLSLIRFGIFHVIFRKDFVDTNKSSLKIFLSELSKTFQYFIIAVFSTFGVFWIFLFNLDNEGFSIDLISVWFGIHNRSITWLPAFSILSLLRLGIILIRIRKSERKSGLTRNKKDRGENQ